jgi:hypothetical protein
MPLSWSNRLESPCKGFEGPHSAPPPTSIGRAIEERKRLCETNCRAELTCLFQRYHITEKYYNNKIITSTAQITLLDRVWLYKEYENVSSIIPY